ncbi:hypothetical protein H3C66_04650 [Patescibacteria group bacterium]|nr:hypothetical protein [Patescibacteria group bacterium]
MAKQLGEFRYSKMTPKGWVATDPMATTAELTLLAAEKYGITSRELPGTRIMELEYQGQKAYFQAQNPFAQSCIALYATSNKTIEKNLLTEAGISVAKGFTINKTDSREYWREVFEAVPKPLVLKPTHGTQGRQVYTSIEKYEDFEKAVEDILPSHPAMAAGVVVETMFQGEEYRVLVTREKVIGITNRKPANVVGDGTSTIQQLIDIKNQDPRRKNDPNNYLVTINVDKHVLSYLASQNLTLESVVEEGQQIFLRKNSNISTGGDSIDVTDIAHPSVGELSLRAIQAFPGLLIAGIDFMTTDITQPQTADSYIIVEVNNSPGYSIHDLPYQGKNRHAADEYLKILFPTLEIKTDD